MKLQLMDVLQVRIKEVRRRHLKIFFFFFQFAGAVCSCVNLFTIPLRNRFLIRLLASLNPGYHYERAN